MTFHRLKLKSADSSEWVSFHQFVGTLAVNERLFLKNRDRVGVYFLEEFLESPRLGDFSHKTE